MVTKIVERYDGETEFGEIVREIGETTYYAGIYSTEPGHAFELKFWESHDSIESAREAIQKNLKKPYIKTIGG